MVPKVENDSKTGHSVHPWDSSHSPSSLWVLVNTTVRQCSVLNFILPKRHVEVPIPNTSECDLIGNRVFIGVVSLRYGPVWALIRYECCPYKKRNFGNRDRCTEERWCEELGSTCDNEGRVWLVHPWATDTEDCRLKARGQETAMEQVPLWPSQGTNSTVTLISGF